ncbi:MAG: hypothetical protein ABIX01_18950 [Chitinophagaceae bacterium]
MNLNNYISPEVFDEIESYLSQKMTAAMQEVFSKRLATETLLQEQVKMVQLIITGIKEQALQERLDSFHQALQERVAKTVSLTPKTAWKTWLAVASVLLAFVVGGYWILNRQSPDEKLFATYFKPDPGLISAMSTTDNYVFDKAMIDYKTGDYQNAITAWQGLLKNDQNNDTLNYFIGAGYVALKETKTAIPFLQKVVAVTQSYFVKDAYWYLGLAMIKEDRLADAKDLINKSEHPNKEQLLKELK